MIGKIQIQLFLKVEGPVHLVCKIRGGLGVGNIFFLGGPQFGLRIRWGPRPPPLSATGSVGDNILINTKFEIPDLSLISLCVCTLSKIFLCKSGKKLEIHK